MFYTILIFILVLSLLVFVHELGHFFVARKMGMKVEEFGFGFPPRLFGYKKGNTTYSINWIPIGGFVKIKGESGEHKDHSDSFASKKPWKRFLVLIAGVTMNLVLAAVLLSIGFMIGMPSMVDDNTPAYANIEDSKIQVMTVVEESPISKAGVLPGDVLTSIDGRIFEKAIEAHEYIGEHGEEGIEVVFKRGEDEFFTTELVSEELEEVGIVGVGVGLIQTALVSFPIHRAVLHGIQATGQFTWEITKAFGTIIKDMVVSQEVSVAISGPVGIAVLAGEVASLGLVYLLQFTAILSINLAIINVLPFPALDGGRILFLAIEKIRRKPVDQRVETIIHNLGFLLLMLLVIVITLKDFQVFGGQILGGLKSIIGV